MKRFKKISVSLLVLALIMVVNSRPIFAADEEYTYTVRLYAGNQGALNNGGISVNSRSASISSKGDCIEVSGLKYGDMVYIRPQDAANVTDERYYVRGVRRSGRDNAEAESPAFYVACDRDYVVAYGVKGDMAAYTVHYQDEEGNTLQKSDTYYGNIGERQYVSSRYIEGYQPRSLNMVKTLSANAAENVFTFRYTRVDAGGTQTPGGTTPPPAAPAAPGGTTTTTTTTTTAGGGGTPGAADAGDAAAPGADAGADAGAEDAGDGEALPGGDAGVNLPDEEVPLDQQELEDLDDGEVPTSDVKLEQGTVMGYLPVYIGIGVAAASALAASAFYLHRRRKKAAVSSAGKTDDSSAERKK